MKLVGLTLTWISWQIYHPKIVFNKDVNRGLMENYLNLTGFNDESILTIKTGDIYIYTYIYIYIVPYVQYLQY